MQLPKEINEKVTVILSLVLILTLLLPWYEMSTYSAGVNSMSGGSIGFGYSGSVDFYFIDVFKNAKFIFKLIYLIIPISAGILLHGAWKNNGIYIIERKYLTIGLLISMATYIIDNQSLLNFGGITMKFNIFHLGSSFALLSSILLHFNNFANKLYLKYIYKG